jgi:hypothetical protein
MNKVITKTIEEIEKEETLDTGVIYRITNEKDNKIYIGKAYSYEKHGKQNPSYFSGKGRLRRHISNALSNNDKASNECPQLYEAIRKDGKDSFKVDVLKITTKKHLKEYETRQIKKYKSYDPKIGYNFFVGDSKPLDGKNKERLETMRAKSNRERCKDGSQRKANSDLKLPANIYPVYRKDNNEKNYVAGYKFQVRDSNRKLHSKAFTKKSMSMKDKLKLCIESLDLKKESLNLDCKDIESEEIEIEKKKIELDDNEENLDHKIENLCDTIYENFCDKDNYDDIMKMIYDKLLSKKKITKKTKKKKKIKN